MNKNRPRKRHPGAAPQVTGLIIFHHEWDAVFRLISEFLDVYPGASILLARDTLTPRPPKGRRLGELVSFLPARSCMQALVDLNWDSLPPATLSIEERLKVVNCHIARMRDAGSNSSTDYILALEHDASIRRRVEVIKNSDVDALDVNPYPSEVLEWVEQISGTAFPLEGWGFVVGTVSKRSCLGVAEWSACNQQTLNDLVSLDARAVYLDFLWPILTHLAGGRVVNSGQVTECNRDKFWRFRNTPLLHQYSPRRSRTLSHRDVAADAEK